MAVSVCYGSTTIAPYVKNPHYHCAISVADCAVGAIHAAGLGMGCFHARHYVRGMLGMGQVLPIFAACVATQIHLFWVVGGHRSGYFFIPTAADNFLICLRFASWHCLASRPPPYFG